MLHEHFQLLRNHFVPLLPFFSPHLEVYEVGRVFPSPLPMADVTSAGPSTWCILTNPAAPSHGRPRSPQPRSCTSSGCCAPTAFSAETALGGAIDKILSFCCLQPGLVVLLERHPPGMLHPLRPNWERQTPRLLRWLFACK